MPSVFSVPDSPDGRALAPIIAQQINAAVWATVALGAVAGASRLGLLAVFPIEAQLAAGFASGVLFIACVAGLFFSVALTLMASPPAVVPQSDEASGQVVAVIQQDFGAVFRAALSASLLGEIFTRFFK